jgi:DNA primase
MESLLATAAPLAEVIWNLEVRGRPVDTPERRALIEKRLMERARAIADRGVQEHYLREFRARLRAAFADFSPVAGARRRARPGAATGRARLASDPLMAGAEGSAEARERVLVATVLNHPEILAEVAEELSGAEIGNHELDSLRQAILEIAATGGVPGAEALAQALAERGFRRTVEALSGAAARVLDWFARPGAARADALIGFRQVLALHQRFGGLRAALEAGESALAEDMTEAQWERFRALKAEAEDPAAAEAEIEDFGLASGRKRGLQGL